MGNHMKIAKERFTLVLNGAILLAREINRTCKANKSKNYHKVRPRILFTWINRKCIIEFSLILSWYWLTFSINFSIDANDKNIEPGIKPVKLRLIFFDE